MDTDTNFIAAVPRKNLFSINGSLNNWSIKLLLNSSFKHLLQGELNKEKRVK